MRRVPSGWLRAIVSRIWPRVRSGVRNTYLSASLPPWSGIRRRTLQAGATVFRIVVLGGVKRPAKTAEPSKFHPGYGRLIHLDENSAIEVRALLTDVDER